MGWKAKKGQKFLKGAFRADCCIQTGHSGIMLLFSACFICLGGNSVLRAPICRRLPPDWPLSALIVATLPLQSDCLRGKNAVEEFAGRARTIAGRSRAACVRLTTFGLRRSVFVPPYNRSQASPFRRAHHDHLCEAYPDAVGRRGGSGKIMVTCSECNIEACEIVAIQNFST